MKLILAALFLTLTAKADATALKLSDNFESWLNRQIEISEVKLIESMSRPDTARGVVIASPSKEKPDYYYHWTRDAGLVMDVVINLYRDTNNTERKALYLQKIHDYVLFSRQNQLSKALTGLGEPKFYVDGRPYDLSWGRPQNDGPALRALALIKFAKLKMAEGDLNYVKTHLYDSVLPSQSVIKNDLEFVASQWRAANFDLWEEDLGDHFFTRVVQMTSLKRGAELAQELGDSGASDWYLRQAVQIQASLKAFYESDKKYILTTLNRRGGMDYKTSNLDVAVILGLLRSNNDHSTFDWSQPKIIGTLEALAESFKIVYPVNRNVEAPAVAIGRYPEDKYSGEGFDGGNPWVLTTLAVAEAYYEMARWTRQNGGNSKTARLYFELGDQYFDRVKFHANADGSLSEQINRFNGYMTSAYDLTWNYAAVLTTHWARERAR